MKTKQNAPEIKQVIELNGKYYEIKELISGFFSFSDKSHPATLSDFPSEVPLITAFAEDPIVNNNPLTPLIRSRLERPDYQAVLQELKKGKNYSYSVFTPKEKKKRYSGLYAATRQVKGKFKISQKGTQVTVTRIR